MKSLWIQKKPVPLHSHLEKCFWQQKTSGNSSVGRARPCQGRGRGFEPRLPLNILNNQATEKSYAQVAELVDAHVSGACVSRRAGSSPVLGTLLFKRIYYVWRGGGIGRRATLRG